jgi:FAD/FMN-containing dehydrogenase
MARRLRRRLVVPPSCSSTGCPSRRAATAKGHAYDATWPNAMRTTMSAWSTGGAYVNYLDPLLEDWAQAYYGANYARLQQVKKAYDPDRVLSMPQGVVPAA